MSELGRPRRLASNLRYKQLLVLKYFAEYPLAPASPAMVAQWIREKYGYEPGSKEEFKQFCKKLHDTMVSLVKRKLLVKVSYGLYQPTDIGMQLARLLASRLSNNELRAQLRRRRGEDGNGEVEGGPPSAVRGGSVRLSDAGGSVCSSGVEGSVYSSGTDRSVRASGVGRSVCSSSVGGSVCAGGSSVVLRFHCFRSGVEGGVERLVKAVEAVYRFALYLRRYFRSVLGVSRWRKLVRSVSLRVTGLPALGVHGFHCEKHKPLKPLSVALPVFREVGVDVPVVLGGIGDIHVKVYTAPITVYLEHLERYKPSKTPKRLTAQLTTWSAHRGV